MVVRAEAAKTDSRGECSECGENNGGRTDLARAEPLVVRPLVVGPLAGPDIGPSAKKRHAIHGIPE
ncbi:hypothetical protein GCM10022220_67260 [Actinocatenispora rupis]